MFPSKACGAHLRCIDLFDVKIKSVPRGQHDLFIAEFTAGWVQIMANINIPKRFRNTNAKHKNNFCN